MNNILGIVDLRENEDVFNELIKMRPLAALPFGGRYRLIDFVLSNMVNSGIFSIGILVQHKYRSLMDHLRSGKEWDLARKKGGLAILPPAYSQDPNIPYRGDVENFFANLDYIRKSSVDYVAISGVNMVCNLNYRDVLKYHIDREADITVVYQEEELKDKSLTGIFVKIDNDGRIIDMHIGVGNHGTGKMCMNICFMGKNLLVDLIEAAYTRGEYDFVKDCILKALSKYRVFGYPYKGYVSHIYDINSYFQHSMELLTPDIWRDLFFKNGSVYTKVKDEPPVTYAEHSRVKNSLVAGGCIIEGDVENSILFRGVIVRKGAVIRNSILMQKTTVEEGARLSYVICDKDVHISLDRQLKGDPNYLFVIKKGTVI